MARVTVEATAFTWQHDREFVRVEAWGDHALRVRTTVSGEVVETPGSGLLEDRETATAVAVAADAGSATISNGRISAHIDEAGILSFRDAERGELFREVTPHFASPRQRRYRPAGGDLYHCETMFQAPAGERVFGLGQQQHGLYDQKGAVIDLVQRNTAVAIPFALSSAGYGFLWNMPGVGRVELATNHTRWYADGARQMDYWVIAGETPADIVRGYAQATGLPPMMPDWATGYWQFKLRYKTQEELLSVAREHKRRGLPMSVIAIDYFHWTRSGEWRFDPEEWPDPTAMVAELRELGIEPIVSVWPTVSMNAEGYDEMEDRGLLVGNAAGMPVHLPFWDKDVEGRVFYRYYDATNPEARAYIWERVREGYYRHGIRTFWLDATDPEMQPENPDDLRFHLGQGTEVQGVYPREHARGFYEALRAEGEEVMLLCRSAWVGSQRYGAALWSGDIDSTFEALLAQVRAGINVAVAGVPWWTTDIGGFIGGDPDDESFRELVVRWFQFGVFCPIFRLHGIREPRSAGAGQTGGPNEVWSFGEAAYEIIRDQLELRERLRPYVAAQMEVAHRTGLPPMRGLFLEFPDEEGAWAADDQFMFGPDVLVAPITVEGARSREVFLPEGAEWVDAWTGERVPSGRRLADAPLERIPVYLRSGGSLTAL